MEIQQVQTDSVSDFMSQYLTQEIKPQTPETTPTLEQQLAPEGGAVSTEETHEGEKPKEKTVEEVIAGAKPEEKPKFFATPQELADKLIEEKILYPYDDGTKPQTSEEILDSLKQSSLYNAEEKAKELVQQKLQAYSPALQTIIQYAENGVTTATELNNFVNHVSHFEKVSTLDPKNPDDQEQIVFMQLVNTGIDDKTAREEIVDLKERNKLANAAEKYHPILKTAYQNQVNSLYAEKQREVEQVQQWIDTNVTNVSHFLEHEDKFVAFKLSRKDKASTFSLAAQPTGFDPDGNATFKWQEYIQSLQYGTEDQFKEYMKIMTFVANTKGYDDSVRKVASNQSKTESHKKINTGALRSNSSETQEEGSTPVIRKPGSNPWFVNE